MITKQQVLQTLDNLPGEFDAEELVERIILLKKIKQGEEDIKAGNTLTTEEVKKKLGKWLQ